MAARFPLGSRVGRSGHLATADLENLAFFTHYSDQASAASSARPPSHKSRGAGGTAGTANAVSFVCGSAVLEGLGLLASGSSSRTTDSTLSLPSSALRNKMISGASSNCTLRSCKSDMACDRMLLHGLVARSGNSNGWTGLGSGSALWRGRGGGDRGLEGFCGTKEAMECRERCEISQTPTTTTPPPATNHAPTTTTPPPHPPQARHAGMLLVHDTATTTTTSSSSFAARNPPSVP